MLPYTPTGRRRRRSKRKKPISSAFVVLLAMAMMATTTIMPATTMMRRRGMAFFRIVGVSGFQRQQRRPKHFLLPPPSSSSVLFARGATFAAPGVGAAAAASDPAFRNRFFSSLSNRPGAIAPFSSSSSGGGVASPSALLMGRSGGRRRWRERNPKEKLPPRVMQVPENGETPDVAAVQPELYKQMLDEKVARMEAMMLEAIAGVDVDPEEGDEEDDDDDSDSSFDGIGLPPTEVFESPKEGYRMRANFKMWRTGGVKGGEGNKSSTVGEDKAVEAIEEVGAVEAVEAVEALEAVKAVEDIEEVEEVSIQPIRVDYVMFERGDSRTPWRVTEYPMGSPLLRELMGPVREAIQSNEELRRKINDVRFLTTLQGDALVTMTYNRPIGDEWRAAAARLVEELERSVGFRPGSIALVGRSRKVKLVVRGGDAADEADGADDAATARETLNVPIVADGAPAKREFRYEQTEGAFSQPNAVVCQSMLGWAHDATRPADGNAADAADGGDLCELYCGNGCFTVVLASNFRRVVATEMSKASVDLARRNLAMNGVGNVRVAKLNAEDFVLAYEGQKSFRRLADAGIGSFSKGEDEGGDEGGDEGEDEGGDEGEDEGEATSSKDVMHFDRLRTLFVDPPRAGLDETCRALAAEFERVVYVSCNPETLARDVSELVATHEVTRVAAFDQFPYTPHLEAGIVLEKRKTMK